MKIEFKPVLKKAVELLEERGWCQGKLRDEYGRMCVLGAMFEASRILYKNCLATEDIDELGSFLGDHPTPWNDTPGRTQEEVIVKLRELVNQL